MTRCFRRCLSRHARLRASHIFGPPGCSAGKRKRVEEADNLSGTAELPVKLEVCSGNGDWVVAQAKKEKGKANWMALELKHNRVHSIFSRAVFEQVDNLCLIRGDASQVLPRHLQMASVSHVFINFPEPPHVSGHGHAESKHEFLTADFFKDLCRVLKPGGRITIFSDNHKYIRVLARRVASVAEEDGKLLFASAVLKADHDVDLTLSKDVKGVQLHCGTPGTCAGHAVQTTSFFDRLWKHGSHSDRYFFVAEKG
ncbi:unnamed protein product [Polarella glacialis]|uniref:tRNA (guanine(46)-N(7))-methyltransferase n=1 Tax=Polarella glacialis TaxID=89957 RepID=A0A813DLJ6_POLGL|nr:unnamed protein product [Polarella glacialis]